MQCRCIERVKHVRGIRESSPLVLLSVVGVRMTRGADRLALVCALSRDVSPGHPREQWLVVEDMDDIVDRREDLHPLQTVSKAMKWVAGSNWGSARRHS